MGAAACTQSRNLPASAAVLNQLVEATNRHDLDDLVACFSPVYVNETPLHPARSFIGRDQVRKNWTQLFVGLPDLRVQVLRTAVDGQAVWSEWEMQGTRRDGTRHLMRGIILWHVQDGSITSARFYLEPVEERGVDVNGAVRQATGT